MNGVSYLYSDRLALRAMRAQEVGPQQAPRLYAMVAELASSQGLPMPRVYISPSAPPNAFATGRNPSHAAVGVPTGLLEMLDERELRGVLGHEISHVGNRDILIASVAAGLASMVMILVNLAQLGALFGFHGSEDDSGPGFLEIVLLALLGLLAAGLIQAAISRSREYAADASGARTTGDPLALAGLVSSLMIDNPISGRAMMRMFSTHPRHRAAHRSAAKHGTGHECMNAPKPCSLRRDAGQVGGPDQARIRTQFGDPQLGHRPVTVTG